MYFFDLAFWKDFVSNGLSTLLGVLFGIPVALWLDRLISSRRHAQEMEQACLVSKARRLQFVDMLVETLSKNQQLVTQMKEQLTPGTVIFYNVDTLTLDATSSIKYDIIDDLKLNRLLDSVRFELSHLYRKVELQLEISYGSNSSRELYEAKRTQLIQAIHDHFPRIERELAEALALLSALRGTLETRSAVVSNPAES